METAPSHETPFYEPASAARLPTSEPLAPARSDGRRRERLAALVEVLLCSGLPTQLVIGQALALGGWSPFTTAGVPQAGPLFALALLDTLVLLVLIAVLLHARGESIHDLLLGGRPLGREAWRGARARASLVSRGRRDAARHPAPGAVAAQRAGEPVRAP